MFIVIEGLDGAGKSTQVARLQQFFSERGFGWEYIHFPRFTAPYFGELIAAFLRGELGAVDQVDPRVVAMLYAGDRHDAAKMIENWQQQGKIVIIDRYVLSNVAYQCGKLTEGKEQLKEWILGLEYNHFAIPKPDLTLFLDVPFVFTEKSLTKERTGDDRDYLKGKKDIHEASLDLQRAVRQVYVTHQEENYHIIDCGTPDGEMAHPDIISGKIIASIEASAGWQAIAK